MDRFPGGLRSDIQTDYAVIPGLEIKYIYVFYTERSNSLFALPYHFVWHSQEFADYLRQHLSLLKFITLTEEAVLFSSRKP